VNTASVTVTPAAWYADPLGRSLYRYWDGSSWTAWVSDGRHQFAESPATGPDPALRWLLPVGRSGWAIAAGYAGLFAFLVFPAPIALLLGVVALFDLRRHPERLGWGRAIFGTIVGGLGTALLLFALVSA
jgi:Domain of unknown function (DUF4190)/Protein of unknown function (DUF2510)